MMVVVVWPKTWPRCVIQTGGLAQLNSQTGDASEAAIESWSWDCRSPPELPPTSSPNKFGEILRGKTLITLDSIDNYFTRMNFPGKKEIWGKQFQEVEVSWDLRPPHPPPAAQLTVATSTHFTMGLDININWKTPSRINTLCLGHCGGKFLMENFGWKFLAQKAISNILKHPALSFKYNIHRVFEVRF